jgi:WD40 repeat protein
VLPHLSHALAETWQRREGTVLTVEAYEAVGGITGSIARSAEDLFSSLTAEERVQCHALLRRLVSLTPEGRPVQHRVVAGPLRADPHRSAIIARLLEARLVSVAGEMITVAHESLATAWPRLHAWLEEDAEGARILEHLSAAAQSWDDAGRAADELYRGARLRTALEWSSSSSPDLTATEADFLTASAEREFADEHRAAESALREQRQNRLRRILLVSAVTLVVGSLAATAIAIRGVEDSARQRESADIERLVGTSLSLRSSQRAVAALLAVEARTRWPDDHRTRAALMGTFTATPSLIGTSTVAGTEQFAAQPIPGTGDAVVARDDGSAGVYEIATARLRRELELPPSGITYAFRPALAVSADARTAVIARPLDSERSNRAIQEPEASELIAVDLASGDAIAPPGKLSVDAVQVAVDPSGSSAAVVGEDGRIRVIDLTSMRVQAVRYPWMTGQRAYPFTGKAAVTFVDDGRLAIGSGDAVGMVDLATMDDATTFALPPEFAVRLIAQADSVLVTAGDSGILAMEAGTGAVVWRQEFSGQDSTCTSLSVSTARGAAWCSTEAGQVVEYDLATGSSKERFLQPASGTFPSADGTEIVVAGAEEPVLSRWSLDDEGAITRVVARESTLFGGYSPQGESVLVADRSTRVHAWDVLTDSSRLELPPDTVRAVWAGDEALLVEAAGQFQPTLLDTTTGEPIPSQNLPDFAFTEFSWTTGRRLPIAGEMNVWVLDPATGDVLSGPFDLDGAWATSVSSLPDGSRMLVTSLIDGVHTTRMLDVESGAFLDPELVGPEVITLVSDALAVGADGSRLLTYAVEDFGVTGSLPSTAARTTSLQASTDGGTLLATGTDGSASLFDLPSGLRLGDVIPSAAGSAFAASLRPDGRELAVAHADGVQVWDLDPEAQVEAACRIAGRDLTREEWDEHLGSIAPYRSTCGFGSAAD